MSRPNHRHSRILQHSALAGVVVLALLVSAFGDPPRAFTVGAFSQVDPGQLPSNWSAMPLGDLRHSTYETVDVDGRTVVRAHADDSASGFIREITINPRDFPVLEWQWKAESVLRGGNVARKSGDDYAARIYITFDYDETNLSFSERVKYRAAQALTSQDIPLRALSYIWSNEVLSDTPVPNPYTDWVMMVPVEGGTPKLGTWVRERRNIVEDYRRAFGEDPPAITGIALMTDADNTGESVTAYYGDLVLRGE